MFLERVLSKTPKAFEKKKGKKKKIGKKERERELKWWNTSPRNSTVLRIR